VSGYVCLALHLDSAVDNMDDRQCLTDVMELNSVRIIGDECNNTKKLAVPNPSSPFMHSWVLMVHCVCYLHDHFCLKYLGQLEQIIIIIIIFFFMALQPFVGPWPLP
jgi:hypothetical protein